MGNNTNTNTNTNNNNNTLQSNNKSTRILNWLSQINNKKSLLPWKKENNKVQFVPDERRNSQQTICSCSSSNHDTRYKFNQLQYLKRNSISSSLSCTPNCSRPNSIYDHPDFDLLDTSIPCQKDRWVIKHELIKLAVDGLFGFHELVTLSSSIEKYVLQIGCGNANWGIDLAIQNPKWMVIGIDDQQHQYNISPKNFKFIKCHSILEGLKRFSDFTFDFISSRFLILESTFKQYQYLINECVRLCKPNGYIEVLEMDMRIYHHRLLSSSTTSLLNNEIFQLIESKNLDPRLARKLKELVPHHQNISNKTKYISLPLGIWGGRLGVMFRDDIHKLFQKCTSKDIDCKIQLLDNEIDLNRAFMNLHLMLICKHK